MHLVPPEDLTVPVTPAGAGAAAVPTPAVERALREYVRDRLFTPPDPAAPPRIGLEVEVIPVDAVTRRALPIRAPHGIDRAHSGAALVGDAGRRAGWTELPETYGAPRWRTRSGGTLSFEPGGQVEYSTPPCDSVRQVAGDAASVLAVLHAAAAARGAELLELGMDPESDPRTVPLQLVAERYVRMDAQFAARGGAGQRMMRNTAALQVNLDLGADPAVRWLRWRVLGRAAPYLNAAFANSRRHAGRDTGHSSHRAWTWRRLDRSRTGVVPAGADFEEAVDRYTRFALAARWILDPCHAAGARGGEGPASFSRALREGRADERAWREHLTTLFPEVRPQGRLEVRCLDALPMSRMAVPVMALAGLAYDDAALRAADRLLDEPTAGLLERAAAAGMSDPDVGRTARELVAIGLAGHERLPPSLR